jgi:hypothetical protein
LTGNLRLARRGLFGLLFLAVAGLCSLPRFGQRENEALPSVSDSDFYLDMAAVFGGTAARFNPEYVESGSGHVHYNRPLLPFLAAQVARLLPSHRLRTAFSLVGIVSVALAALLLMEAMRLWRPGTRIAWLPSLLLLSGYPQMNWGYHILTDGIGLATAFISAWYSAWLVRHAEAPASWPWVKWAAALIGLFLLSSMAFLARETAWLAVITTGWLIYRRRAVPGSARLYYVLILVSLLLGKIPHIWYGSYYQVYGVVFRQPIRNLLDWRYLLDFLVKAVVCFNLSWITAMAALRLKPSARVPDFITGWTVGSLLYIGAGYFGNNLMTVGYPMRMLYVLFPLVYFLVATFLERCVSPSRLIAAAVGYWGVQTAINWVGVLLDPGKGKITALDAAAKLKALLGL